MRTRIGYILGYLLLTVILLAGCTPALATDVQDALPGATEETATGETFPESNAETSAEATKIIEAIGAESDETILISDTLRIHILRLGVSSTYLIEAEDSMVLVDAGVRFADRLVIRELEKIGRRDLCLIFITHAHIDHYGGAAALRRETDAGIAIQADDAKSMAAGNTELGSVRDWEWTEGPLPHLEPLLRVEPTEPDLILHDGDTMEECGINAEVIHTPGHTPGSSTLLLEGKYAFVGDLISTVGDIHPQSSYAHDWPTLADSIRHVQALEPLLSFPGHGRTLITNDMLQEMELTGPLGNAENTESQ